MTKIEIINGKEYIKLSELRKLLKSIYDKPDEEVSEDYNEGWDGCINEISDDLDLQMYLEHQRFKKIKNEKKNS